MVVGRECVVLCRTGVNVNSSNESIDVCVLCGSEVCEVIYIALSSFKRKTFCRRLRQQKRLSRRELVVLSPSPQ